MVTSSYIVVPDEIDALREAVEVLEDMFEQRDAETERWFQRWLDEYEAHHDTKAALRDADAMVDDYAARLKATNEAFRKLSVSRDYADDRLKMVRERIKTYRAALSSIVKAGPRGHGYYLANHVLNSQINDGGSDF